MEEAIGRKHKRRTQKYARLLAAISQSLYEEDPDRMGSSGGAPADEHDSPATHLLPQATRCRTRDQLAHVLRGHYPDATDRLIDQLWTQVAEYQAEA